jgi:soluble lytic murein transglycosylase-like protein/sulfur relay (sulfurtransferase) DsrC/TusE family protein
MTKKVLFRYFKCSILGYLTAVSVSCSPPLRKAEELVAAHKYKQAQPLLEKLHNEDPELVTAQALLAETLFYTQGPLQALEHLHPLYLKHSEELPVRQLIQKIDTELRAFDSLVHESSALPKITAYLKKAPNNYLKERTQWLLLQAYKQADLKKEYKETFEKLKQDSQDPFIQQLLDWDSLQSGPKEISRLLDLYPKSDLRPLWYWQIIEQLAQEKKVQEANGFLMHFKEESQDSQLKATILLRQGEYNLERNPVVALNYFRNFLQNYPKHPAGRPLIYTIREKLGKYLSNGDHSFLAQAAFKRYMYQTAVGELQATEPKSSGDLLLLGEYARKADFHAVARQAFGRILQTYPRSREAGLASVNLAALQRMNKAYTPALSQLHLVRSSYKSQPEVIAEALWEEGLVYDFMNQPEKQASVCRMLLELDSSSEKVPDALWIVVWQAYLHNDYPEVVRLIQKYRAVIDKHPLESRFLYWLARSQESLDQREDARKIYQDLAEGPLLDYYTHRGKERLRVLMRGGDDRFATQTYQGYLPQAARLPGFAEAFQARLKEAEFSNKDWSEALQLFYLGQKAEFLTLAENSAQDQLLYLRGLLLNQDGRYYETITQYRYLAKDNPLFVPVAFPLANWFQTMEKEAQKYKMNPFLVAGLSWQESQYKPDIQSWVGATGLMQIMPTTAEHIAQQMKIKKYDLKDAVTNIRMGTWYLNSTHKTFEGNSLFAVASYNAGAGPVLRWKKEFAHLPYDALAEAITYPETRDYVKKVFTAYWIYQGLYGKPVNP